jgi:hypothetical protein
MTQRKKIGTSLGFFALGLAAATTYLWFRQAGLVALPEDLTVFIVIFVASALMGVASFVVGTKWYGGIPAVFAILVAAFISGTIYISPQQVADNPVKVGDVIPQFVALNDDGERFNSNSLSGKPTLIKFFRGHW